MAAVDSAVTAAIGCAAATVLIVAARPHVDRVTINGSRLAPWELHLFGPLVVGSIVTVGVFSVIAVAATRSVASSREATRRKVRPRAAVTWPVAALTITAAAIWLGATAPPPEDGLWRRAVLQWTMPLLGFSVIGALPSIVRGGACLAGRAPLSVAGRIAQRRLAYDPEGGCRPARLLATTCFCVVVTAVILTKL